MLVPAVVAQGTLPHVRTSTQSLPPGKSRGSPDLRDPPSPASCVLYVEAYLALIISVEL